MFLTYSQAFYELKNKLQPLYDEREATALSHEILFFVTGLDKTQRLLNKHNHFTAMQQEQYTRAVYELLQGCPLQYVTGSAWFAGREYYVNRSVLIPRPETEELVRWITDDLELQIANRDLNILDIGTGSGCIPISIKLALPQTTVAAYDISSEALEIARQNADRLQADIDWIQIDVLDTTQHNKLGVYDVIVSNPPYIPGAEVAQLHINVKDYEPHIALFVPDNDALVFYKAIALLGKKHLAAGGYIYCELDAGHAMECKKLFEEMGYANVLVRKDINDNWRMLKAESAN